MNAIHPSSQPQPVLLCEWKSWVEMGLAAARRPAPAEARAHYLQALELAQTLLAAEPGEVADDDRLAAFVVTHLNLADSCVDAGQPDAAVLYLCRTHRTLLALPCDEAAPEPLRQAACRHLRQT